MRQILFFLPHYKNFCASFKFGQRLHVAPLRKLLKLPIARFQVISIGLNKSECIYKAVVTFDMVLNDFSSGHFKHELRKWPLKLNSICL